jgi:hypothetical protein
VSGVYVAGIGAITPAGWGMPSLRRALAENAALPVKEVRRVGLASPFKIRPVPAPVTRPAFLGHPRLRRTSPISQFALAASIEALGEDAAAVANGTLRLGVVSCVATGCMNYSARFFDEVLREPATASPLLFPETVFNAPSSHLAAYLWTTAINYTIVGDASAFLQGVALGAAWLIEQRVDGVLVVGAEENHWTASDAYRRISRTAVLTEGAGAVYLTGNPSGSTPIELAGITDAEMFFDQPTRRAAMERVRRQLPPGDAASLLCDGRTGVARFDAPETYTWRNWPGRRLSPQAILGEAFGAGVAWQCVAALDALRHGSAASAIVSTAGGNEAAIGAHFNQGG